ncbi:TniQ family protein [Streptomyces sp. NBC_01518]|uniref:TniQ family protein n=1 Tax=Streptomyces sp. NBC_01518 TaxID=2903891 RepID=UPI00386500CD
MLVPPSLPRRLPAVPQPAAVESFFSWVDHLAHFYEVDRVSMMRALGLAQRSRPTPSRELIRYTMRMSEDAGRAVKAATGLTGGDLFFMTLPYLDMCHGFGRHSFRRPKQTWAFCPQCLAPEGRWPLWWYEEWAAACPVQRCYLVSFCPHCNNPFTPERTASLRSEAGRCWGFGGASASGRPPGAVRRHCGTRLWEIDTEPVRDPAVLHAVERLRDSVTPPALQPLGSCLGTYRVLDTLLDWQAVRVRSFHSPDPLLQHRFASQQIAARDRGDDFSGFLGPRDMTADGIDDPLRNPIFRACRLSVIGRILTSDNMSATAHDLLEIVHSTKANVSSIPQYQGVQPASPGLNGFLRAVFDQGAAGSSEYRTPQPPPPRRPPIA